MDKFKKTRKKTLKNVLNKSFQLGYLGKGDTMNVNFDFMLRDLYFINKFFSYLYGILINGDSDKQIAKELSKIKDPYGKKLFTYKQAVNLLKKHKKPFQKLYKNLLQKNISNIAMIQGGGGDSLRMAYNEFGKKIDIAIHPLHHYKNLGKTDLEQLLRGVPIDMVGILITNLDFIWEFAAPLVHALLTTVGSVVTTSVTTAAGTGIGAIIAGVGEVVLTPVGNIGGPAVWTLVGDPILSMLTEKVVDIARFLFDVSNKNLGGAINRLITIIPYLSDFPQTVVGILLTIKPQIEKADDIIVGITNGLNIGTTAISSILENPGILVNKESIYEKIVRKGITKTPYYNGLTEEKKQAFETGLSKFWNNTTNALECVVDKRVPILDSLSSDTKNELAKLLEPCMAQLINSVRK